MQFKATIQPSSGDNAVTQVSDPWPTLPADLTGITIVATEQNVVNLNVEPLGSLSARPIGVKCCVLANYVNRLTGTAQNSLVAIMEQTKATQSFSSSGPTFLSEEAFNTNSACKQVVGSVQTSVVTGYPASITMNENAMASSIESGHLISMATTDGSNADTSLACAAQQLQRCTQYAFQCGVQNLAGWSATSARSSVVQTLPALPSKLAKPQIEQEGANNEKQKHQFTVVLEAPGDTVTNGGWCSEYTFRVHVSNHTTGGVINVISDTSGNAAGNFIVSGLTAATTYTVIMYALNQAGWSEASDDLEVSDMVQ